MSTHGLEALEHTVQLTHVWINALDERLGWNSKPRAYRLLKAVLHALRDWLPHEEADDLAAQLPTLLRGAYYEQWRPARTPVKHRKHADFLACVDAAFAADPLPDTAAAVTAVFDVLTEKISVGEVEDLRGSLPEDIRNLWLSPFLTFGEVL
jgi:uncharacterized protein (DUF2267 family)